MDSHEQTRVKLAPVTVWFALLPFCLLVSASDVQVNIIAKPGQTVSLPCQGPDNLPIISVQWSRPDLEPEYILLYRDGRSDPEIQHSSFRNRVGLKDKQMKDGDVSLIVENVVINDTGTYECRVIQRNNRFLLDTDPIATMNLTVTELGGGAGHTEDGGNQDVKRGENFGLIVGLSVFLLIMVVVVVLVFLIYRKLKKTQRGGSYEAPEHQ